MEMALEKTRAVSIRASRNYILALGKVAENIGRPMGDIMRELVDERFGTEIEPYLDALDGVDNGRNNFQTEAKSS